MPEKCKNIFLAPTCQSATHNSQSHTHHLGALTAFAAPPPIPIVRGIEINHPLLTPWEWRDADTMLDHLDALEIWNDPTWPDNAWANPGAVDYWTRLLNAGYRITALDGAVLVEERGAAGRAQVQWRNQIDPDEPAWFRCDALDADDRFLAVSNPIFTGPRQTPCPALLANSCLTPDAMAQLTINDTTIDADLVIFDKDGTLIDFEFYWGERTRRCGERLIERVGGDDALRTVLFSSLGFDPTTGQTAGDGPLATATMSAAATMTSL